jgi:DNA-binding NtrC family response regulator
LETVMTADSENGIASLHARSDASIEQVVDHPLLCLQGLLDTLPAHSAILDASGTILAVNEGWRRFARENAFHAPNYGIGLDYLAVCDRAAEASDAARAASGIRSVMKGHRAAFFLEYACPGPVDPSWFHLRVARFEHRGADCFLITHQPITAPRQAELKLKTAVEEIARLRDRLTAENLCLQEEIKESSGFEEIIGQSEALRQIFHQVAQVANTGATVLLLGETGAGKELVARAIHERSPRKDRALVKVNCAALPPTLVESELFGHEKGAFTGALAQRAGRFEIADGGTIFLDEIGDLPLELQMKLLRVLQEGEFERVGSPKTLRVDVRVIAATNRDLGKAMAEGSFRADLYYRLRVFPIEMPPLRERRDDIPLLVEYFVARCRTRLGRTVDTVPRRVMDALIAYDWPGNVRELENVIERAVILSPGRTLRLEEPLIWAYPLRRKQPSADSLTQIQRAHILRVVEECGWRLKGKGNAAERLGVNASTLRSRMKKLGIDPARPAVGLPALHLHLVAPNGKILVNERAKRSAQT